MIYEFPETEASIRQGDIFRTVPRVEVSLEDFIVVSRDNQHEASTWEVVRSSAEPVTAVLAVRPVWAIVITQDCDTVRAPDISLCEIRPLVEVLKQKTPPKSDASWMRLLTEQTVMNLKWFYLPPDSRVGFTGRMAADFLTTLRIPREDLEKARHLRAGRLNYMADEHFRERLGEFYRRYPYNEWYPLAKAEFEAYRTARSDEADSIEPYEWQR